MQRIAIIGGGISGLSAAFRLRELRPAVELTLYESNANLGGVLQTRRHDRFLIERGADMFTTREPWAMDLCRRLGIADQLIETNPQHRRAFIVYGKRLVSVPDGFTLMSPTRIGPFVRTPLLSWAGKLRVAAEYFVPRRTTETDESLAAFTIRRLGREAYERLVQPLIAGIYTADPEKLSMQAALPQFVEMEQSHGGIIRGVRAGRVNHANESGARYGSFLAPRDGMASLITALAEQLPTSSVRLNTVVRSVSPQADGRWQLSAADHEPAHYDGLIVATPATSAARLLAGIDQPLAAELGQIPYASAAVVVLGFRRAQIRHPLDGFGCVVPMVERRRLLSISFSSVKFSGRAPLDSVLLRAFVGGACQEQLVELPDKELRQLVMEELTELLAVEGPPLFCEIVRWRGAMPQYHLDHLRRVERIEQMVGARSNFELAGNAYRGVGIPFCIRSGERAAESLLGAQQAGH